MPAHLVCCISVGMFSYDKKPAATGSSPGGWPRRSELDSTEGGIHMPEDPNKQKPSGQETEEQRREREKRDREKREREGGSGGQQGNR